WLSAAPSPAAIQRPIAVRGAALRGTGSGESPYSTAGRARRRILMQHSETGGSDRSRAGTPFGRRAPTFAADGSTDYQDSELTDAAQS
ncbi:MAG TPA: hypothetical protein VES36_10985, partial [Candidatus Limnocylindrales bacterium]|nr:hypothetical protein [Candidatus Limnocylindrales bacterium]